MRRAKVTSEQMDEILRYVKSDGQGKDADFPDIKLNPYDYNDNGGELEFNVVVYESEIANRIEEVQNYPDAYSEYSEERIKELKSGAKLTPEEISQIREEYIEEVRNDESAEYAVVSEITDGSRSAYTLYFEGVWGQAGLHVNDIYGYYETEDEARKEMNNMRNVIIEKKIARRRPLIKGGVMKIFVLPRITTHLENS